MRETSETSFGTAGLIIGTLVIFRLRNHHEDGSHAFILEEFHSVIHDIIKPDVRGENEYGRCNNSIRQIYSQIHYLIFEIFGNITLPIRLPGLDYM